MRAFFLLLCLCVDAFGADIIPASRMVPWTNGVGVQGGIPSVTTVFSNVASEITRAQCQTILTSCPSNQVVLLGPWTNATAWTGDLDWIGIGNGKVLRGTTNSLGQPLTRIKSSGSIILMRIGADETKLSTDANLAANTAKGDTNCSVNPIPSWCAPGTIIGIDQLDDTSISFNPGQESGTSYREIMGNGGRGMAQLVRIVSTNGTTINFDSPLAYGFTTAKTAQIFQAFGTTMRIRCGVEDIAWEHTGSASSDNHLIKMETCDNCWLKNVWGTNMVGGMYVFSISSYHCEIRQCWFSNSKAVGSGQGYGVGLYHFSTSCLVEDNIIERLHVWLQNNYGSVFNVFTYNFELDGQSDSGQNPGISGHGTTGYMTLFEGNWCEDKVLADFTHGAGYAYTFFRNRVLGKNNSQTTDQTAISIERYNRACNVVGNVLGLASWHTNYLVAPAGGSYSGSIATCSDKSIYKMGYFANIGCTTSSTDSFATLDPLVAVNLDTVTATNTGVVLGGFATSDLVNSYYLLSKPTMFGFLSWPPYSPTDATGTNTLSYTNIPAGYRYANGTNPPAAMAQADGIGTPRRKLQGLRLRQ